MLKQVVALYYYAQINPLKPNDYGISHPLQELRTVFCPDDVFIYVFRVCESGISATQLVGLYRRFNTFCAS